MTNSTDNTTIPENTQPSTNPQYSTYGWICPKCGKVLAPWMQSCPDCVSTPLPKCPPYPHYPVYPYYTEHLYYPLYPIFMCSTADPTIKY